MRLRYWLADPRDYRDRRSDARDHYRGVHEDSETERTSELVATPMHPMHRLSLYICPNREITESRIVCWTIATKITYQSSCPLVASCFAGIVSCQSSESEIQTMSGNTGARPLCDWAGS